MQRGEFTCIIGHSGCGKTTVLNILAGLDAPSEGTVIVDNQAIEGPSLDRAVIFQGHALLPWRTVMGNVAYAVSSKWRALERRAGARAGAEIHRPRRPHRRRAQAPGRALRRHEAARRHRARALDRAEDHADGRAVLRARRAHPRHAAGRGAPHLPGDRADRVHDHPRRRRGDLPRRQDRADDQRPRRGAGRDRREPAAEGPRAHRHPQAPALLRGAQPHHRFPGHAQPRPSPRQTPDFDPRHVPVVRPGVSSRSRRCDRRCRHRHAGLDAGNPSPRSAIRAGCAGSSPAHDDRVHSQGEPP